MRNCLDAYLCQIVCDKDGVMDWCIVRLEMPRTQFEECWPFPRESLPELPLKPQHSNPNPNPLTNQLRYIDFLTPPTPLIIPYRLPTFFESLTKTDAWFMQDASKAVWRIPYVSVAAFFPSLKQNFIAYRSSSRPDCIFVIHQQWQSGFSRVYSNYCCSCCFEPEIIKIGQSSHKMDSNNILNFQESMSILNAHTKKVKLIVCTSYIYTHTDTHTHTHIYIYIYIYIQITIVGSVCVNGLRGRGSIPGRKDRKNSTWWFFLNTEHYKVRIKWSNPAKEKRPTPHFGVVANKKETSIRPRLRLLTLLLLIYIYI